MSSLPISWQWTCSTSLQSTNVLYDKNDYDEERSLIGILYCLDNELAAKTRQT